MNGKNGTYGRRSSGIFHIADLKFERGARAGPDREPSAARSAFNCAGSVESVYARHCIRGRCEPRTARGPVAVPTCARDTLGPAFLLAGLLPGAEHGWPLLRPLEPRATEVMRRPESIWT